MRKRNGPKFELWEIQLEVVSIMKYFRLKKPFEICEIGSFQEDHKVTQYHRFKVILKILKAFDRSKKTHLTSRDELQPNASNTSCVIASD